MGEWRKRVAFVCTTVSISRSHHTAWCPSQLPGIKSAELQPSTQPSISHYGCTHLCRRSVQHFSHFFLSVLLSFFHSYISSFFCLASLLRIMGTNKGYNYFHNYLTFSSNKFIHAITRYECTQKQTLRWYIYTSPPTREIKRPRHWARDHHIPDPALRRRCHRFILTSCNFTILLSFRLTIF